MRWRPQRARALGSGQGRGTRVAVHDIIGSSPDVRRRRGGGVVKIRTHGALLRLLLLLLLLM